MGFGGGAPQIKQDPLPEPPKQKVEEPTDPEALKNARKRAEDFERRKNRRTLTIPLQIEGGGGSGLSIV